jgi:hypothetical protein
MKKIAVKMREAMAKRCQRRRGMEGREGSDIVSVSINGLKRKS